jgi:hypothetical protein
MIYQIPEVFKTLTNHTYPPGNNVIFEQFFRERFERDNIVLNRKYLPIQWTNFYISRNYATNDMSDLQSFLDSLSRDEKYFTVVQWDDGIKNDLKDLDIEIFASGGVGDYPIPLINQPYIKVERNRDIFASFIGVISGRHRVREKLKEILNNKNEYLISESCGFPKFKETMERSIFALCPRGYGKTSFRINEALNLGAIPVYVYDEPWIPFNDSIDFNDYGVLIHESEIENIDIILKNISNEKILSLQKNGKEIYEEYFTYNGCFNKIINKMINKI